MCLDGGAVCTGDCPDDGKAEAVASTAIYARAKGWAVVIPPEAWAGGLAAAIVIGAFAGLLSAIRAARLAPTRALWSR